MASAEQPCKPPNVAAKAAPPPPPAATPAVWGPGQCRRRLRRRRQRWQLALVFFQNCMRMGAGLRQNTKARGVGHQLVKIQFCCLHALGAHATFSSGCVIDVGLTCVRLMGAIN